MWMLDATHSDINMAHFFKKLIVRLIGGVHIKEATPDVRQVLADAELKFDRHIKNMLAATPCL